MPLQQFAHLSSPLIAATLPSSSTPRPLPNDRFPSEAPAGPRVLFESERAGRCAGLSFVMRSRSIPKLVGRRPSQRAQSFPIIGDGPFLSGTAISDQFTIFRQQKTLSFFAQSLLAKMRWHWPKKALAALGKQRRTEENPLKQFAYTEQSLRPDQLAELYPLARINAANPLASRGISKEEARLRLTELRQGHGRLSMARLRTLAVPILPQLLHSFRALLLLSSLAWLAIFLANPAEPATLMAAFLQFAVLSISSLAAAFEHWHGRQQAKTFMGTRPSVDEQPLAVLREGREVPVQAEQILDGDLLFLRAGQRLPVDTRILKIVDGPLLSDCGWLGTSSTGEPLPFTDATAPRHVDVFQARNVLFAGSLCTRGSALGLAIRTGKRTLLSQLGPADEEQHPKESRLRQDFHGLLRLALWVSVGFALLALFATLPTSGDPLATFMCPFLLLLVAGLPQSLPLVWSCQMFWMARRLKRRCGGMVLRVADMSDALGATSVLMIHNPSVLSTNRPVLTDLWLASSDHTIPAGDFVDWAVRQRREGTAAPNQRELAARFGQSAVDLLGMAKLSYCTKAEDRMHFHGPFWQSLRRSKRGSLSKAPLPPQSDCPPSPIGTLTHDELPRVRPPIGDPLEAALAKFLDQLMPSSVCHSGVELLGTEETNPLAPSPCQLALASLEDGRCRLMARGPPEMLLGMCATVRSDDGELPLTEEHLLQFEQQFLHFSAQSKRCLGLALLDFPEGCPPPGLSRCSSVASSASSALSSCTDDLSDLTGQSGGGWSFLGMLAFADPVRPESAAAVRTLETAGVRMVLVSDEHPALVQTLAKRCGLDRPPIGLGNGHPESAKIPASKAKQSKWKHFIHRSSFPRLHKTHSTGSSGYHSTEQIPISGRQSQAGSRPMDDEEGWPVDGEALAEMDEAELDLVLTGQGHLLFSRLEAAQIGQLAKRLKAKGNCSLTFIGQNGLIDGQAMREANLAIAGTECHSPGALLAQRTADVLCPVPTLATVLCAVRECRAPRANLASVFTFALSQWPALLLPFLLSPLIGLPQPLTVLQVLIVGLLSTILPSIALVFCASPPIGKFSSKNQANGHLFGHALIGGIPLAIGSFLAMLSVFWTAGLAMDDLLGSADLFWAADSENMTMSNGGQLVADQQLELLGKSAAAWMLTLVAAQQFHALFCAAHGHNGLMISLRNAALWAAILVDIALLALFIYSPGLNALFGIVPPPGHTWLFPVAIALVLFVLFQLQKVFHRKEVTRIYPQETSK